MSIRVKIQQFGGRLSAMVIPNLGAFMAWGIITAVAIAANNDTLRAFIGPMLTYLLPLLIAFAAGRAVHGYRGGVMAMIVTMGAIINSDITMFIGAMVLGPLAAWIIKKFDQLIDGKIPPGFELLVNNFSIGIIGAILAVLAYLLFAPALTIVTNVLASGVNFLIERHLLPLTAIVIEPAKVFFLNNAIGQGILSPLGSIQVSEVGKSVLYLLESNPGPGMGVLLAYMFFGKGNSKASSYGAAIVHFFGGIHEIYFPFVLMNPILIIALIAGGITGTLMFSILNVGLVGVASPGSIISIMMMSSMGDHIKILLSIIVSMAVTFAIAIPLVKRAKSSDDALSEATKEMEGLKGKKSRISSMLMNDTNTIDFSKVTRIAYACDAGMGSSAMGASILKKMIKEAGIDDIIVSHIAVTELPTECEIIVTHQSLLDRVKKQQPGLYYVAITDFLNAPEYKELVSKLAEAKKQS